MSKKSPSDFLKMVLGRAVIVKLNSGVEYRGTLWCAPQICCCGRFLTALYPTGILACLDGYMNIAMEQTEEYVDGQLKTKYGDAFIRGNNGRAAI